MSKESIETLKEYVDPTVLLSTLGFKIYYDSQEEIRAPCIIHGGDNRTAFCFKKQSKRFYCFSHKCELNESGEVDNDIICLVMRIKKCSFMDAIHFLGELTGYNVELGESVPEEKIKLKKDRDTKKFIHGVAKQKKLSDLDEVIVSEYFSRGCPYFERLGISTEIINKFELGTMVDDFGVERAAIPIRDEYNRLVSISGRRTDGNKEPRYRLVRNFKKSRVLYNFNNALKSRDDFNRSIIIVEGFKALWSVYSCGFTNVVAVMGMTITQDQINLLVRYGYNLLYILLDGDEKGKEGTEKTMGMLKGKIDCIPIYLPDNASPDDLTCEGIIDIFSLFS